EDGVAFKPGCRQGVRGPVGALASFAGGYAGSPAKRDARGRRFAGEQSDDKETEEHGGIVGTQCRKRENARRLQTATFVGRDLEASLGIEVGWVDHPAWLAR